jgi:hypothetical protein
MSTFRAMRKVTQCDCLEYKGDTLSEIADVVEFAGERNVRTVENGLEVRDITTDNWCVINPGDILIKGNKGQVYGCAPDVFASLYDIIAK